MAELEAALQGQVKRITRSLNRLLCQIDSVEASIERVGWRQPERPAPLSLRRSCWWTASRNWADDGPSHHQPEPTWGADRASVRLGRGGAGAITRVRAKQRSGKTRKGNRALRRALVEDRLSRRSSADIPASTVSSSLWVQSGDGGGSALYLADRLLPAGAPGALPRIGGDYFDETASRQHHQAWLLVWKSWATRRPWRWRRQWGQSKAWWRIGRPAIFRAVSLELWRNCLLSSRLVNFQAW